MALRISEGEFDEKVLQAKLPVLVDFYSDSCVACKKLAPLLGDLEDDYEDRILVYKVNTNYEQALAQKYDITANPTLLLVVDGAVKDRKVGALSPMKLNAWVKAYIQD